MPQIILIMTPWESLLQSNNGSLIINQLALIALVILEYIYIYIYICREREREREREKEREIEFFRLSRLSLVL